MDKADGDEEFTKSCLYFLPKESDVSLKDVYGKKYISIIGEEFLSSHSDPIPVRITAKHVDKEQATKYADPFYQENLNLQSKLPSSGYGEHSMFSIASDCCLGPLSLSEGLRHLVNHLIPNNVRSIIHLNDGRSSLLGKKIKELLPWSEQLKEVRLLKLSDS